MTRLFATFTAVLLGLSFAFPTAAGTLYTNWNDATSTFDNLNKIIRFGNTCDGSAWGAKYTYWSMTPTTSMMVGSARMRLFTSATVGTFTFSPYLQITDGVTIWSALSATEVTDTYDDVYFYFLAPYPSFASGTTITFRLWNPTSLPVPTGANSNGVFSYNVVTSTYGFGDETLVNCDGSHYEYGSAGYGAPRMELYGSVGTSEEPISEGEGVPSSTYSGDYDELLPSIGWGEPLVTPASSSEFVLHINSMLGNATDTFPTCMVYPWFTMLDELNGSLTTGTSQTIALLGGMFGTSTFVLSLAAVPNVLALTGFGNLFSTILTIFEAVAWLMFGLVVFRDLFMSGQANDADV